MMNNLDPTQLKEELQYNLMTYLDCMEDRILNDVCDIVIETIDNSLKN